MSRGSRYWRLQRKRNRRLRLLETISGGLYLHLWDTASITPLGKSGIPPELFGMLSDSFPKFPWKGNRWVRRDEWRRYRHACKRAIRRGDDLPAFKHDWLD